MVPQTTRRLPRRGGPNRGAARCRRAWIRLGSLAGLLALLVQAPGCTDCGRSTGDEVVVYTSVDQVFSEPIFRLCETRAGLRVRAVYDTEETKSTGVLNRLLAEAANPQADLFWSGDPVRPFVLIARGLVTPYRSPAAADLPATFKDRRGMWTGFAARARVLLVNDNRVLEAEMPRSIRDLANPRWRGQVAMANPLFGTTTIHVAALFAAWGDNDAKRFLQSLKENRIRVAASNGEVKRLVVDGEVAFGLTDTDDAFEAVRAGAPVKVVYPDQEGMGTLVMPTVTVLIKGGAHPAAAQRLDDCLLGKEVEQQLAQVAAHMPLHPGVEAPPGVPTAATIHAMDVDYAQVAETMTRIEPWLRRWAGL